MAIAEAIETGRGVDVGPVRQAEMDRRTFVYRLAALGGLAAGGTLALLFPAEGSTSDRRDGNAPDSNSAREMGETQSNCAK